MQEDNNNTSDDLLHRHNRQIFSIQTGLRSIPNFTIDISNRWNCHSIPLAEEDRHLTTFITPWGRYRYRVCPQGYLASGDAYTKRFDKSIADITEKIKIIDDTLIWSDDINNSLFRAIEWLDTCGKHGIIINPERFVFAKESVMFGSGFEITLTTVGPCPQSIRAMRDFPTPKNLTGIRSLVL
ncbi:enzymatic polyprotein [Plakobranchus ocellatus]|uniref:Enzymatic polyprotein n=1 Tax=Plakobranchus ocellatus TaxID=259542 RepID=A0AAV4B6H4_9GAST|nr:enzymatic polyprotein [Plakobranchus ocellatus]